jgi:ComF family protein
MLLEYQIYRLIWIAIDWIYPPRCAGCQVFGYRWCETCQEKTTTVKENQCVYCGRILKENRSCAYCVDRTTSLNQIYAWGEHDGPLRLALHQLKYRRDVGLGEELSYHLLQLIKGRDINFDIVVPIPLGRKRQKDRGYNQSALLARPLALALGLPYRSRALKRIRDTRTQVGLSIGQRRKNVAGAFEARPNLVAGKRILLVDDVMTTGATMDAAGQAVKQAGAIEIFGLTLARATRMIT